MSKNVIISTIVGTILLSVVCVFAVYKVITKGTVEKPNIAAEELHEEDVIREDSADVSEPIEDAEELVETPAQQMPETYTEEQSETLKETLYGDSEKQDESKVQEILDTYDSYEIFSEGIDDLTGIPYQYYTAVKDGQSYTVMFDFLEEGVVVNELMDMSNTDE